MFRRSKCLRTSCFEAGLIAVALLMIPSLGAAASVAAASPSAHKSDFVLNVYALNDGSQHGQVRLATQGGGALNVQLDLLRADQSSTYGVEIVYGTASAGLTQISIGNLTTNSAGYASFRAEGVQFSQLDVEVQVVISGTDLYLTQFAVLD